MSPPNDTALRALSGPAPLKQVIPEKVFHTMLEPLRALSGPAPLKRP